MALEGGGNLAWGGCPRLGDFQIKIVSMCLIISLKLLSSFIFDVRILLLKESSRIIRIGNLFLFNLAFENILIRDVISIVIWLVIMR